MAQLVLSTIGAAIGARVAPAAFRAIGQALGRAAGNALGARVDNALFGESHDRSGPRATELYLQASTAGAPIPWVAGRMRLSGQVIWAARFKEHAKTQTTSQGGKGGGRSARTTIYTYSLSFAVGLCEGPIAGIGRVWANGTLLDMSRVTWRLHTGDANQAPDPLIEAIEGAANTPAYRGLAYVVFEDLPLDEFGNAVPSLSIEVIAGVPQAASDRLESLARGVCLIPGAGEFVYAKDPVRRDLGDGRTTAENQHASESRTDFEVAIDQLQAELPNVTSVLLVVSWFGLDLRMSQCAIRPGVETAAKQTTPTAWRGGGCSRAQAHVISQSGQGPAYGGTPDDASVIAAIKALKARGLKVGLYPFLMMDIAAGSGKPDPYGASEQAPYPWRGRITLDVAPGRLGTPDKTAAAQTQVAAFFGNASPADFSATATQVNYSGPNEWSFRRFILHHAKLAEAAGGVDAFVMGSELAGVTGVRAANASFPAVTALTALAQDVRAVIGSTAKLTYAADWTEYAGIRPTDSTGDVYFHLDPLWADPAISCVGIDWYPPLTDWRDTQGHLDGSLANAIHDRSYLQGRIEAGEAYEWYYPNAAARVAQTRQAITDGANGKPWVFRPKDLRAFWSNAHFNRPGGVEATAPTAWTPQSKPIWLIELGCPAVDKGTNSPNLFLDPKSSASGLPFASNATRDDLIQRRMLEAYLLYWRAPGTHNPASTQYQGPMIDPEGTHLWCWDARPYPAFPALGDVWADAPAWSRGHWLNGRVGAADLADVIEVLCRRAGVSAVDASKASGLVAGLAVDGPAAARSALEPLMQAHGLVARARAGKLHFEPETQSLGRTIDQNLTVWPEEGDATSVERPDAADLPAQTRLQYIDAAQDYRTAEAVARVQDPTANATLALTAPMVLTPQTAQRLAEQALRTARAATRPRQVVCAPACMDLEPGDVVRILQDPAPGDYRIAAIRDGQARHMELLPLAPPSDPDVALPLATMARPVSMATPKLIVLDLPPLPGAEDDDRPFAAVWASPWPGPIDLYWGDTATTARFVAQTNASAAIGTLQWALWPGPVGRWDEGNRIRVHMPEAALESVTARAILDGANVFAIQAADGVWEIIQARQAVLVEPHVYELSGLLRASTGRRPKTDGPIPVGAPIVRLDQALTRLNLATSDWAIERALFAVQAGRAPTHPSAAQRAFRWDTIAKTPLAPSHLRATPQPNGDRLVTWNRCARAGGDVWAPVEPRQEPDGEGYRVQVLANGNVVRTVQVNAPSFRYLAADWAAEIPPSAAVKVRVVQLGEGGRLGWETESAISG